MPEPSRMLLDELLDMYAKGAHDFPRGSPAWENCDDHFRLLDQAKLFLINGAVVDDLYALPHDATNYRTALHLPFPVIFFELMDALEVRINDEHSRQVKGLLFGKTLDLFHDGLTRTFSTDDDYELHFFSEGQGNQAYPSDVMYFKLSELPAFNFRFGRLFTYRYDPAHGVRDAHEGVFDSMVVMSRAGVITDATDQPTRERIMGNFGRMLDLCMNIVEYINAHNVVIQKTARETRDPGELARINRGREKHGKRPLPPLRPYHWIQIRQGAARQTEQGDGGALEYKEWVRGHFQRYHAREGIVRNWIEPYVRGPEGAPWREARYEVLDDMLRRGSHY